MGIHPEPVVDELVYSWTLVGEDWALLGNKSGVTRLGFALLGVAAANSIDSHRAAADPYDTIKSVFCSDATIGRLGTPWISGGIAVNYGRLVPCSSNERSPPHHV